MIRKLLVLLLCLTAATATAKKPKSSASKKAESSAEKPKESDYDKLFKEKHTVADGMFRLHDVKGKLYFEIPDSLFGREMLLGSTISEVSDNAAATTGSKSDYPLHVVFTRNDRSVQLRTVNCENITDETGASRALAEAVKRNTADPILRNYKIEAWNRDSTAVVVNVTDLFVADVEEMSPFSKYGLYTAFELKKTFQTERSMLGEIKAFSDNVVVRSTLSYIFTLTRGRTTLVKDQPLTAVMTRSLVLLPREPYRPRITDSRMSVFPTGKVLFSEREQRAKVIYYAHRWRLEPSDMDAWKRGERVAPKKQIVFYVDDGFPEMWKKHIFEAVDQWNEPFGRIGFKNAIAAKPYPKDDPEFDPDNIKYSCIRYAPIAIANAMGPSWVDPRSGEILGTDIFVPFNFTAAIQKKLLLTLSAADPEARTTQPSARQIADALTAMVARRAASAFGVMPNYAASSAYPTDSLRSPSFTRENGLAASITDDVFYNIVAQPGDRERGVKLVADALGPYDYLAVEWLYKPVPGAVTPHDEVPELRRLLASKEGDPRCFFAQYASGTYDPRVGAGDLGDDLFRSVALQSANLKYVAEHGDGWLSGRDGDYKFREELLTEMVLRVNSLALQLMRYIGGVYMNPVYEGTARPACTAVPREVQRRALREALALTADLGWIDRQGVSKNVYNRVQACEYLQRRIARTLLEKLGTLDLAASKADDPYTADLMAKDLVAWFEERLRSREPLTDHVRNLQQSLLKSTVAAANVKDKPSSGSGSAFALFDGSGSLSDGGDLFPATDAGALPDMPAERRADDFTPLGAGEVQGAAYGYRTPRVIPAFREHLFYGLLLDMKAMYRRGAASAPLADTRSFCRYMADRIDRELAVE